MYLSKGTLSQQKIRHYMMFTECTFRLLSKSPQLLFKHKQGYHLPGP